MESVLERSGESDEEILKKAEDHFKGVMGSIYNAFKHMDNNGDGMLTKDEFMEGLRNPSTLAQLHRVDISLQDAEEMFDIVDYDQSGELSLEEFIPLICNAHSPLLTSTPSGIHSSH